MAEVRKCASDRRSLHLNCKFRTCFSQHPIRGASKRVGSKEGVGFCVTLARRAYVQNKLALLSQLREREGETNEERPQIWMENEANELRRRKFYGGRFEISSLTDGLRDGLTPRRSRPLFVSHESTSLYMYSSIYALCTCACVCSLQNSCL